MISVRIISDESEFADLKTTWNELLKQSSADTPFLTWQWLYSWWKVYGEQSELMILAVQKDQEIIALAPLMMRTRSLGFLKAKEIVFLGSFGVGSDYLDFVIMKGAEYTTIDAIIGYVAKNEQKWDMIGLTNILETSESIDHLNKACKKIGYFNTVAASVVCPSIQLPSTWDEYVSTLSKSVRSDIRRKNTKLCKSADIEYEVIRKNDDLNAAMNDLIQLNKVE